MHQVKFSISTALRVGQSNAELQNSAKIALVKLRICSKAVVEVHLQLENLAVTYETTREGRIGGYLSVNFKQKGSAHPRRLS